MKTLIEIDALVINSVEIQAEGICGDVETTWVFSRDEFEEWAEREGMLEWVTDYSDMAGEHMQESGTITFNHFMETADLFKIIPKFLSVRITEDLCKTEKFLPKFKAA